MPAILALVPFKDWVYAGIIATLLVGFGVYTVHERHEGAQKIEAADAKVAAAQIVHNAEVGNVVKAKVKAAVDEYDALAPIPKPLVVPRIVCFASGGSSVLQGSKAASGSNGAGAGVSVSTAPSGQGFDPAAAVSADAAAADVEIDHLQKKIALLQKYVAALQDGGLVAR